MFLGMTADEVAGVSAGIVVIIIVLITFSLLLCVFVTVWRRRRAAGKPGKQLCDTLRFHAVKLNMFTSSLQVYLDLVADSPSQATAVRDGYSTLHDEIDFGLHVIHSSYTSLQYFNS